jgi:hypothetical protein
VNRSGTHGCPREYAIWKRRTNNALAEQRIAPVECEAQVTPARPSHGRWKALAAFALVNGIAAVPVLGTIFRWVSGLGEAALYGGGFLGLALVILGLVGLVLSLALLVAWFVACIQLWRARRAGILILRSLCSVNLAVSLVVLTRMWVNWDKFERWAAASAPDPLNALQNYENKIILLVSLAVVYSSVLLYTAFVVPHGKAAG